MVHGTGLRVGLDSFQGRDLMEIRNGNSGDNNGESARLAFVFLILKKCEAREKRAEIQPIIYCVI